MAWAERLEREFPGIGNQPNRVQGLVALKPYRNPEPRPAVAALVDGRAYVMVDGRPDLFPVLSNHGYVLEGRDVRVLTINSHKWRRYYMIAIDGWTTPDTFSAARLGRAGSADGEWWPTEKEIVNTPIPLFRQGRLHVAIWAVALLVIGWSAMSVPSGSPARQSIAGLLVLASIGFFVTSVTAIFARRRQRRS